MGRREEYEGGGGIGGGSDNDGSSSESEKLRHFNNTHPEVCVYCCELLTEPRDEENKGSDIGDGTYAHLVSSMPPDYLQMSLHVRGWEEVLMAGKLLQMVMREFLILNQ